ncbi:MAG TPA: Rho termination factor N-terminal domain-containing protein [Solirubrobacteraceae bacterium]|jgi:transcription termination factor Rho|nr:Rho termination factor N-terminal domain-containing protein [Solirubrobacteraceae bacterium]
MAVLERSELEASPLADLHTIANEVGLDGFRRLRKADLIDAILGEASAEGGEDSPDDGERPESAPRARRRRPLRSRRSSEDAPLGAQAGDARDANAEADRDADALGGDDEPAAADDDTDTEAADGGARRGRRRGTRGGSAASDASGRGSARGRGRAAAREGSGARDGAEQDGEEAARIAAGVVEVLGNGSAFLRVDPPEPSDEDVYISAAQVRRCELVSGDRVTGPVRTPRRSERYPSLVRIDTINGTSADAVSDGARYEELPVDWPRERIALGSDDPTLEAIEWLTPLGRGSRVVIVGSRGAGKSETLRRMLAVISGLEELETSLVLAGARPEEIADWQDGPVTPSAALTFAASADAQDQAVERAIDAAKRVAARGGNALVAIDAIDGLHPAAARKALASARNLREGGSLTVIALAERPLGGETTVIALDAALTSTARQPILDLAASATLKPELLVGEDGAEAISKARAAAVEAS